MEHQIAVVICNYNGGSYLERCIASLLASGRNDFDIFVVDNASSDGSAHRAQNKYPAVSVLQNRENLGGAGGFQTGFRYALDKGYPYVMSMDNDAYVAPDTMTLLYDYLKGHPEAGMAAAKIMCLEEPDRVLDYNGKLDYGKLTVQMDWWFKPDAPEAQEVREADFAPTTASMLTRAALQKSGGMDPDYFIYLDDIEMSQRILRSGLKVMSIGQARAFHKSGLSQAGAATTFKQYYFDRNRYYFFARFAPESDVDEVAENILKDTFHTMLRGIRDGYPAVFETARYVLEDFLHNTRGKAKAGRILKLRHITEKQTPFASEEGEYAFFRALYYDRVMKRIGTLRQEMKEKEGKMPAKVSVVIPVYNTEKYLRCCLDSVLGQTLKELEVICVDDGSFDGSPSILDEYAKNDARVKVIHKENEGYGKAMNIGIEQASAPYFGIVESDDFIEPEMYERIYEEMLRTHADVIKADYYNTYEREGRMVKKYVPLDQTGGGELYRQILDPRDTPELLLYGKYTWSGLYRTEFVKENNIRHHETPGAAYQDNGFWFQTMTRARKVCFLDEAFYNYRQDNAAASFFNKGNAMAELNEFCYIEEKLKELGEEGEAFYGWLSFFLLSNGYYSFHRVDQQFKKAVAERVREEYIRLSGEEKINYELFPDWIRTELFYLLSNPKKAAIRDAMIWDGFIGKLAAYPKYVIYGAGKWGRQLVEHMLSERLHQRVVCFAVSDMDGNPEQIEEIPVRCFDKGMVDEETLFIIAMKHMEGIEETLRSAGVKNIIYSTDLKY